MVVVTHTNNTTAYNNDRQQRHVRIGIELGNESESEQCEMLMQFLDWSYEFIFGSEIGQINDHVHNASTGLFGDLITGQIDMLCKSALMTPSHLAAHDFTYPIVAMGRETYIIRMSADPIHQSAFIGRPFAWNLWFAIIISVCITIGAFSIMQVIIDRTGTPCSSIRFVEIGIMQWTKVSMGFHNTGETQIRSFASVKFASFPWLLLWRPVILQLYQANLKTYLSVSDRLNLPFTDFDGLVTQLRSGVFQIILSSESKPSCPASYGTDADCAIFLDEILSAHPPIYASANFDEIDMPNNVVEAVSYSTELIPDKVSILLSDVTYKAKILAIVNDQITTPSAAFPLRKGFAQRSQLNKAAIALCESLFTILRFRNGRIMVPLRFDPIPIRSAFTLFQLISAFQLFALGLGLAALAFLCEIFSLLFCL